MRSTASSEASFGAIYQVGESLGTLQKRARRMRKTTPPPSRILPTGALVGRRGRETASEGPLPVAPLTTYPQYRLHAPAHAQRIQLVGKVRAGHERLAPFGAIE